MRETEATRLEAARLANDADRRALRYWFVSLVLVVPAVFAWGPAGGAFVLLALLSMIGAAAYLVRVARKRIERAMLDAID